MNKSLNFGPKKTKVAKNFMNYNIINKKVCQSESPIIFRAGALKYAFLTNKSIKNQILLFKGPWNSIPSSLHKIGNRSPPKKQESSSPSLFKTIHGAPKAYKLKI